jgi:hypothetical protein
MAPPFINSRKRFAKVQILKNPGMEIAPGFRFQAVSWKERIN